MFEEAGGIVNDFCKFKKNYIDIRASSAAINNEMIDSLKNF